MADPKPPPPASTRLELERPDVNDGRDPRLENTNPGFPLFQYEYMKKKLAELDAHFADNLKKQGNSLTIRSVVVAIGAVAAGVIAGIIFIDNRVHAETDAGTRVQSEKHDALKARVETLEKRFDRFDTKMDLVLDAQHVPQWKRPPPLDGGSP